MPTLSEITYAQDIHSFCQNARRYVAKHGYTRFRKRLLQIARRAKTGAPNPKHILSGKLDKNVALDPTEDPVLLKSLEEFQDYMGTNPPEHMLSKRNFASFVCNNLKEAQKILADRFFDDYKIMWSRFGC